MGVERWFERKASDLRGEVKIHPDRSIFSVGAAVNGRRIWPLRRSPPAQRRELRNGAQGCRRPKKSEEGNSSAFFTQRGNAIGFPVCFRRVLNVLESEAFGIVHREQIGASRRTGGESCRKKGGESMP